MNWKFWQKKKEDAPKKSKVREWVDAVTFAVVVATLVRTFFIEAYTIPSASMERSLLIGDFLFVSKVNYGARIPMTPVAFPFAHHTMPLTSATKAYWEGVQWKYRRLPGLSDIKRNDVVVFNFPEGDTVIVERQDGNYYQDLRQVNREQIREQYTVVSRPVDKRENFIKRCVGIAGDTISMKNGLVYLNSKAEPAKKTSQIDYTVTFKNNNVNFSVFENMGFKIAQGDITQIGENTYNFLGSEEMMDEVKKLDFIQSAVPQVAKEGEIDLDIFPHDANRKWNVDNFGPIIIPKTGWTVQLNDQTMPLYERCIRIYEGNKLEKVGADWLINGKKATKYTFKMNYYWMLGDNRHRSADSRYWGFVPEDHVVGKALFMWMSWDSFGSFFNKIRWNRLLRGIN
ncbi:MAG: signal peptidase I [Sphingobacteriaceae bacterium]|nr:signal peptidase I [Sphingobacteriaceae bacterium]